MLQFITKKDRIKIRTEYFLRVLVFIFLMSMFLGIMAYLLILPTHMVSLERSKESEELSKQLLVNVDEAINPASIIKEINEVIVSTKSLDQRVKLSDTIENIIISDTKDVSLVVFYIDRTNEGVIKVLLKGNAKTRDALSDLVKDLRKNSFFESVELPVSGFAKSTDIDFSINILTKK